MVSISDIRSDNSASVAFSVRNVNKNLISKLHVAYYLFLQAGKVYWRTINFQYNCYSYCIILTIALISRLKFGYWSADIVCSEKRTVFFSFALRELLALRKCLKNKKKTSEHIFVPNRGYCVYYPSDIFCNTCSRYSSVLAVEYMYSVTRLKEIAQEQKCI